MNKTNSKLLKFYDHLLGLQELEDGELEIINQPLLNKIIEEKFSKAEEARVAREEKENLEKILNSIINSNGAKKEKYNLQSFCMVATGELKEEALITLKTLRLFHSQPAYVICDNQTKAFLKGAVDNLHFCNSANPNSLKKIKEKYFKTLYKEIKTFHRVECIFKKMDAMDFALRHHGNTFFIDADLVITDKIDQELHKEIMLSPHYHTPDKHHLGSFYGLFNAGYIFCARKDFPDFWRKAYLENSKFYEQECMNRIPLHYDVGLFSKEHNIGFWRDETEKATEKLKMTLPEKVKSFHLHISTGFNFENNLTVKKKNEEFRALVLDYVSEDIKNEIETKQITKKIAHIHFGKCAGAYTKAYLTRHFLHPLNYAVFDSWHIAKRFDFEDSKALGRDWTEDELIEFIDKDKARTFVHNHHFNWSKKTVKHANEKGLLTFCFLRHPKDLLCSLYWWAKDRIAEEKVNVLFDPSAKKAFDLVGTHPDLKNGEGFDSVFSASCLNLTLDDFIRIFSHEENKNGCGKLWNIPDYIDDVQYVAEFSDENFSYFLKKYFDHEYVPAKKINTSQNKGYKFYYDLGEISKETNELINSNPEYTKYSKYMNIKIINV